jgi:hypothetical protein
MRRVLSGLVVAALLGTVAGARPAEDEMKALLIRAFKAHGGEDAIRKYRASRSICKGKIKLGGIGEVEFVEEVATMLPDKFKESMRLDIGGRTGLLLTLVDGDKVSIEADGMPVPLTDEVRKALKDARYLMKVARLGTLIKDRFYEFTALGETRVQGKQVVGVRISCKGHKNVNLYFDKETALLAKVEHRTIDPTTRKEVTEERIILEYKMGKEGVPYPKKAVIKHDGEIYLEAEVLAFEFLEKLDDDVFTLAR